jgi:hypothetical protein
MAKFVVVEVFSSEEFPSYEEAFSIADVRLQEGEDVAIYEVTKKYLPTKVAFKEERL